MTRILHSGWEHGSLAWLTTVEVQLVISSSGPRNGTYHLSVPSNNPSGGRHGYKYLAAPVSEFYFRNGMRADTDSATLRFREGSTVHIDVRLTASGAIAVYRGTTLLASYGAYAGSSYYCVEGHVKIHDTTGIVKINVDGALVIDLTGIDTRNGGTVGQVDNIAFGVSGIGQAYHDDFALNDTAGTVNNSWIGNGRCALMIPNAAGDQTDFTPLSGNNFDNVKQVPHDSDTTYNQSETVDHYDLYNLTTVTLLSGEEVNAIAATAVANLGAAGDGNIKVGIKTASEDWGDAVAMGSDAYRFYQKVYEVDPADSSAFNQAKLDALQVGVKVA